MSEIGEFEFETLAQESRRSAQEVHSRKAEGMKTDSNMNLDAICGSTELPHSV